MLKSKINIYCVPFIKQNFPEQMRLSLENKNQKTTPILHPSVPMTNIQLSLVDGDSDGKMATRKPKQEGESKGPEY